MCYPEAFAKLGLSSSLGILLAGPPGCGKTLLAKVCVCACVCVRACVCICVKCKSLYGVANVHKCCFFC